MNDNDERFVQRFFNEHRREIEDNGFSQQVMRSLPKKQSPLIMYLWSAIGILAMIVYFIAAHCITDVKYIFNLTYHWLMTLVSKSPDIIFNIPLMITVLFLCLFMLKELIQDETA
ncbi:MAG: DUF5056 domain-containing protein [Prevotella sp.]